MTSGATRQDRRAVLAAIAAAAAAGALAFPMSSGAWAETGAWVEAAHAKVRLVSAVTATGDAARVPLGIEIKLDHGWKTYWRAPGEGGVPPRFDWSGSANLAKTEIAWPAPKRFEIAGMEIAGYADHVILPLEAVLAQPGAPLAVRLSLQYAVCREICMLVDAKLALDLPNLARPTAGSMSNAEAIARFRARVPRAGEALGWRIAEVSKKYWGEGANRRELVVVDIANDGAPFAAPELFIESPGIRFGKAMLKTPPVASPLRFYAPVYAAGENRPDLVLTLVDGERAATFTVPAPR